MHCRALPKNGSNHHWHQAIISACFIAYSDLGHKLRSHVNRARVWLRQTRIWINSSAGLRTNSKGGGHFTN